MLTLIKDKVRTLFSSEEGNEIFDSVKCNLLKQADFSASTPGIAVGLSGGADSVFLLCFLYEYRLRTSSTMHLLAIHVNHGIRDGEAERDARFANDLSDALNIEFVRADRDVPRIAREYGLGIEETARNERYSVFKEIISGRNDINYVALAHNSTDNLETVLLNLLRGSGIVGMCGIPPVRERYIRPLISVTSSDIRRLLDINHIPYVNDSTNFSDEYSRNYVRHEIIPRLNRLSDAPETAVLRMTENLRKNLDFVMLYANEVLSVIGDKKIFDVESLRGLHIAVFAEVFKSLVKLRTGILPSEKHISQAYELIQKDNFSTSLPGDFVFCCQRGKCFFDLKEKKADSGIYRLSLGENNILGYDVLIHLGEEFDKTYLNIYNSSIQVCLPNDIIEDGLYVRFKRDGDSYKYRGITHKLKKVFNDVGLLPAERQSVPIFCDNSGIIWVPGLPVRDGIKNGANPVKLTLAFNSGSKEKRIFTIPKVLGKRKTNQKGLEDT